jgi:D-glycero-beta-D-manno-heptose-7-phosphate kinase
MRRAAPKKKCCRHEAPERQAEFWNASSARHDRRMVSGLQLMPDEYRELMNPKTGVRATENLPSFHDARVLVVGDVMLDRYWFGEVGRISPEAPVPVVKVARTEERLGGAANVARNVSALGAQASLLSVIGGDEAGVALERLLQAEAIPSSLHRDAGISTTIKLRVIGRQQQLLRIDFENEPGHEVLAAKLADFERLVQEHDLVILSDYGKGGLAHISRMIALANGMGKRVLVDPKGDEYQRYRGATIVTPNRTEFREVAGRWKTEEELTQKA